MSVENESELGIVRAILEVAGLGAAHFSIDGQILWANEAFARMFGYPVEEMIGKGFAQTIHPDEHSQMRDRRERLIRAEDEIVSGDRRCLRKDGQDFWLHFTGVVQRDGQGQAQRLCAIVQDITGRKRQELALRDSQERLDAILDTVRDVIWSFSATQYRLLYLNEKATREIYQREASEFYSDPDLWIAVVHPEDRALVQGIWGRLASAGSSEDEYRILRPSGEVRWVQARAWLTSGKDGRPERFEGIVRDVTERKMSELALRDSQERLERLMAAGRIGSWELSLATGEVVWSKVMKELCGYPMDFPASLAAFEALIHPEDRERVTRDIEQTIRAGASESDAFRLVRPDGRIVWVHRVGKAQRVGHGASARLIGAVVDVTEAKESELLIEEQRMKMVAASKMSALGEMAGGVAHEINNPLTVIQGYATHLRKLMARGALEQSELAHAVEMIESTSHRISSIVRSLRSFARDGSHDPFQPARAFELLAETASFCSERFRSRGLQLGFEPVEPGLTIECRPVQISQVLLNLLNNACDAVSGLDERWIRLGAREANEFVELTVTDSGQGISQEIREKIFQPFFTTKEVGRGTGLGLSVAKGIVESHGGSLGIDPGGPNTRFVVRLPKRQGVAPRA